MSDALQQEIRHLRTLEGSARDPRDRVFLPLADAHLRLGDLDRARELLEDGLTRHPDFVSGHVLMARLYEEEGDLDQAEERWATARRLDPENADVVLALGRILVGRGEELGGALVLKARSMDPTAGGQEPDADLVSISDLAPEVPVETPIVSIADLAPDAESDIVPISELAPTDVAPDAAAAAVELDAVQDDLARHDPADHEAVDADAEALDTDADVARAEADQVPVDGSEPAPEIPGDGRVVTRTLADLFAAQGQRDRAIEMYQELVSRKPDDESLHARLAELRSDEWGAEDEVPRDDEVPAEDEMPGDIGSVAADLEVPAEADAADEEEFDPRLSPAAPEPEVSTPFAWTASGEAEEGAPDGSESSDDDRPISDYLGGLLGYAPDRSSDDSSRS